MRSKCLPVLLYTVYTASVFTIFMVLCIPLIVPPLFFKTAGKRLSFLGLRIWAHCFRAFSGVRYEVRGQQHLERSHSYVFTPNHTSYLDIPALPLMVHHSFKTLAKQEIAKIPVFGFVARAVTIRVDRSSAANRKSSIARLTQALHTGTNLVVFPEGTINKTDAPLAHFYDGAFRIALETGTPIVPVVIFGAAQLMPPGPIRLKPGKIIVQILPPVPTESLLQKNIQSLKEKVVLEMEQAIGKLRNEAEAMPTKKDTASAVPF